MGNNLKAFAIGVVGAIGGLGAVSLAAQSSDRDSYAGGGDVVLRDGEHAVWHISQGRIRHCRWTETSFGTDVGCTAWQ